MNPGPIARLVQLRHRRSSRAGIKENSLCQHPAAGLRWKTTFDHSPVLEQELRSKGKNKLFGDPKDTNMDSVPIALYPPAQKALGLATSVWCAVRLIGKTNLCGDACPMT